KTKQFFLKAAESPYLKKNARKTAMVFSANRASKGNSCTK
ncbi:conserved hypothetical protein, partial [Listeria seeligeri FSL S4-171]